MKIRVTRPVGGLFPECQPEIGKEYDATRSEPPKGKPFVVIEVGEKKIVLRDGEYEITEEGDETKMGKGKKTAKRAVIALLAGGLSYEDIAAEMGITELTIRKIQREAERMTEPRKAAYTEELTCEEKPKMEPVTQGPGGEISAARLFDELLEERKKVYQLERALLAMVLEKYK